MAKIFLTIILLILPFHVSAITFDIIQKDAPVCSMDKAKDNQNDSCNPDSLINGDNKDKATKDLSNTTKATIQKSRENKEVQNKETKTTATKKTGGKNRLTILFFWGDGCPHCADEKPFLELMKKKYPELEVLSFEVWHSKNNAIKFQNLSSKYGLKATGVPVTFIGTKAIVGFSETLKKDIENAIIDCIKNNCPSPLDEKIFSEPNQPNISKKDDDQVADFKGDDNIIDIPIIGRTDMSKMALPIMTIVIAGLDSFNPCAFFVLFSLLGLLLHAKSRKRMFIIGGVFVFFSGFMYFLFMSAWLNFFLIMGEVAIITSVAGGVSIIIALINIKDFFIFKKGVSLTISDSAKSKLFDRMRKLLKSTSTISMIFGAAILAIAANTYELLCTAGFPMVFTRVLTLNNLPLFEYYMYLIFYNLIYVVPLFLIVLFFTISLGRRQLSESEGRFLKLLSGLMMFGLGITLLIKPSLLNNVLLSSMILLASLVLSLLISFISKTLKWR